MLGTYRETCYIVGYEPADLTVHPPRTAEGGFIFFVKVSSVPKKMSSKESLCFSELFRLKDPKTWFFTIFTQVKF